MWISKKKYEELIIRLDNVEKKVYRFHQYIPEKLDKCRDDINNIQRAIEKNKFNEITYTSIFNKRYISTYENDEIGKYTYIYKDFKEYKIDGLYLYKPIFSVDDNNNNLIHVKDVCYIYDGKDKILTDIKFIVDLQNQTFIRTK